MTRLALPKPSRKSRQPKRRIRSRRKGPHRPGTKAAEKAVQDRAFRACEALWSKIVKYEKGCHFAGKPSPLPSEADQPHACAGYLEAMHGIPRGYHGVSFDTRNGIPGCQKIHAFYSYRREEWAHWLQTYWSPELSDELWAKALFITRYLSASKPDYRVVLENLRAEAKALGLEAA